MALHSASHQWFQPHASALVEFRTVPLGRAKLVEVGMCIGPNNAQGLNVQLARPLTIGTGPTFPFTPDDPNDAVASTTYAITWNVLPTPPTVFLRRQITQAGFGIGVLWIFPQGVVIPPSSSLVVFSIAAGQLASGWFVIDE